jgi:predicted secreted protein
VTVETIMVSIAGEFTVRLKSTPTTGYVWEMHALPDGIQLLGSDYEKPERGIQPGDPAIQAFRFQALEAGEHVISFVLKRQWESDAIASHAVTVKAN